MNRLNEIAERVKAVKDNVDSAMARAGRSDEVIVMAVTKNTDAETVNCALSSGICYIGENRVQEFVQKAESYNINRENIHFIGHLQTNKVKYIIDKVSMIESVDSVRLAGEIDRLAKERNIIMDVLIEINAGNEPAKSGFPLYEALAAIEKIAELKNVKIKGLMCVPPKVDTVASLKLMDELFSMVKSRCIENVHMQYLSTGMSQCYVQAIENGANIVRIGSALFK